MPAVSRLHPQLRPLRGLITDGVRFNALKKEENGYRAESHFGDYQNDPVKFCKEKFNMFITDNIADLMASVVNHKIVIGKSANGIGKTYCAAQLALWYYLCFPGAKVFVSAPPPARNMSNLWGALQKTLFAFPQLFSDTAETKTKIYKNTYPDWFIQQVTIPSSADPKNQEARFAGKHGQYMFFILDEGDGIDDAIYTAIEGCMTSDGNRLLALFNPRHPKGALLRYEEDSYNLDRAKEQKIKVINLSAFDHPNVKTRSTVVDGAVDFTTTLERIRQWTDPLPDSLTLDPKTDIELPEYFQRDIPQPRRRIRDQQFYYKVLGVYPMQAETQLINQTWIGRATRNWEDYHLKHGINHLPVGRPFFGCDIAGPGANADDTVVVIRYGNYVAPLLTLDKQEVSDTIVKISQLYKKYKAEVAYIDGIGIGASVAGGLNAKGCPAVNVMVTTRPTVAPATMGSFERLRDQLYWELRTFLMREDAMLPPDERLREELLVLSYELKDGRIKIIPKDKMKALLGGRSPDALDALALSFYRSDVDTRLNFYDHVKYATFTENSSVEIDFGGKSLKVQLPEVEESDIMAGDIGFFSCDSDSTYWTWFRASIVKLDAFHENIVLIHETKRFMRDTASMVYSLLEANQRRRFSAIYTWKTDEMRLEKKTFNLVVNDFYRMRANEKLKEWPGINTLKIGESVDRKQRHTLYLKEALQKCIPVIFEKVAEATEVWQQMATSDSIPDDGRDALIGLLTLAGRD
jgi:hypothetical protein